MKKYKEYISHINESSAFENDVQKALKKMNKIETYDSWEDFITDLSLEIEPNEKKQQAMIKKLEKLDAESDILQNYAM